MIYNRLGNTDLIVSRLGLGLMRLPLSEANPDFTDSVKLIQGAIKLGINFFDVGTFYCHNHCEYAFGRAIFPEFRKNLVFSGKNSSHQLNSPCWTDQLFNTLKIFKTDSIDIYFLHYLDLKTWNEYYLRKKIIDQIVQAKMRGYFKYIGFSSHDSPENIAAIIDTHFFDAVILQYNLLETENGPVINYANKEGLGVIVMNPLAGGILAENNALFPGDSVIQSGLKHLALKFVFDNSDIHCVLSGMRSIQEAEENIGIMESTGIETGEIDKVLSILENKEKGRWIYCTECKYCLPCPQGINIPEIIRINNKYRLFKADKLFSREYNLLEINAGSCIECGICEGRCPNGFPIMNVMKKTVNKYLE